MIGIRCAAGDDCILGGRITQLFFSCNVSGKKWCIAITGPDKLRCKPKLAAKLKQHALPVCHQGPVYTLWHTKNHRGQGVSTTMMVEIIEVSGRKMTLHINFALAWFLNPSPPKNKKSTCPLKMDHFKKKVVFQPPWIRCYVLFQGSKSLTLFVGGFFVQPSSMDQQMLNCWFGARWFGFLGSPYERVCYCEVWDLSAICFPSYITILSMTLAYAVYLPTCGICYEYGVNVGWILAIEY